MRYILSGGGTGGHIYPALAIADEILKRDKEADILYVGKKGSLEEELVTKAGIKFFPIDIAGLPRKKLNKQTILTFRALLKGLNQCGKLIKTFKPDVVIGTGGYVCAPIVMKAQSKKIKTVIQEQNAFPGKTNKFLAKKADIVALNFEEARKYLKTKNIILTGNPIRDDFQDIDKIKAKRDIGITKNDKLVLSFGGSGGQESTNDAIIEIIKSEKNLDFKLIHITGREHYEYFMNSIKGYELKNIEVLDYSYDIPKLISAADLVIASSSAMTLAEISAVEVASILIPKSYTAGNHQVFNAKSYESKNASIVILESELNGENLYTNIEKLLNDEKKRLEMGKNSGKIGNKRAVKLLVDRIESLINEKK